MAILNSFHLLDQAERLLAPPPAGPPRQVDLRRSISSSYYSLFYNTLTLLADEFVGVTQRTTAKYMLIDRSLDHRLFKGICIEVRKSSPTPRFAPYTPAGGFSNDLKLFTAAAIDLQERRHKADYSPELRYKTSDAKQAISAARSAIRRFSQVDQEHRRIFLTLLLCPPR